MRFSEFRQWRSWFLLRAVVLPFLWYGSASAFASSGSPAAAEKTAATLELHIAPTRNALASDLLEECTRALAEGRMPAGGGYVWAPVRPGMDLRPDLVTGTRMGRTWLLLYNDDSRSMVPDQGWRLVQVSPGTDDSGRPLLTLTFDETGANQMVRITEPHAGQTLAILVGDQVVSAPILPGRGGGLRSAAISGNFTEQQLQDLAAALRRDMIERPPDADVRARRTKLRRDVRAEFPPVQLRNGVTVELLGLCEYPSVGKPWWKPDGSLLAEAPYDNDEGRAFPKGGESGYKLAVRFSGLAGKDIDAYIMPTDAKSTNGGTLAQISSKNRRKNVKYRNDVVDEEIVWQGFVFDDTVDFCEIKVGVCRGRWDDRYWRQPSDAVEWAVFREVPLWPQAAPGLVGRVVDPNGQPVTGAQVALCTKDKGVDIQAGQLRPTKWGGKGGDVVTTDAQGRFSFLSVPEEFHLVAAHERGFAWVTNQELAATGDLPLGPWARIEGTLRIGDTAGANKRVSLLNYINKNAIDQNVHFDYQTRTDADGRFTLEKVPPTWMEIGYMTRMGESSYSDTGRTPIHLLPGEKRKMILGGEGRPVIGRFVAPEGYQGAIYFGAGLRAFATSWPERPQPANYDQMSKREQQQWLQQWLKTPEAAAYYDAMWHNLGRRHYVFHISNDGTFRIEDVIAGKYDFTVWLEEQDTGQGRPEEIGSYYGTVEIPAVPGGRTDEPFDLGGLTVKMKKPALHAGDAAPLFEATTLDGKEIRLADYRGRFVLLSFWHPVSHPELDRLKELHKTYGGTGRLQIIGLGGWDTREEVRNYVAEHQIEWPEIYFGANADDGIAAQYGLPGVPCILLVNPEGKIIATWLRGETLTDTVRQAIDKAN
jgi:peroxiredoxin